ncbi:MAG: DUF475 domain-containing protein [Bacteroidetes bacterium]|nr:DUF475 domain-containing protein [Bacteroidota bacterium]
MQDILNSFLGNDIEATLLLVINIIVIESLLSIDNAAVLASMVMELPEKQRKRALFWGMVGAIGFRIICLFLASFLLKIWWIESVGGFYLLLLSFNYFRKKSRENLKSSKKEKHSKLYNNITKFISPFLATVILIQFMDLAFSIDNVLAVVAFTKNMTLIITGVVIGIITMRFVAVKFVNLMTKYPFLEGSAFLIIGLLGFKLFISIFTHLNPDIYLLKYIGSGGNVPIHQKEQIDMIFSVFTIFIFLSPLITSIAFNYPKNNRKKKKISNS